MGLTTTLGEWLQEQEDAYNRAPKCDCCGEVLPEGDTYYIDFEWLCIDCAQDWLEKHRRDCYEKD